MKKSQVLVFSFGLLLIITLGWLFWIGLHHIIKTRGAPAVISRKISEQNLWTIKADPEEGVADVDLELARKLALSVMEARAEYRPECQRYWHLGNHYYHRCILINFVQRAKNNHSLMEALELARESGTRILISGVDKLMSLDDTIVINAGASDQTIIARIMSYPRVTGDLAKRSGFRCLDLSRPKPCLDFVERLQKNESLKGVVANAKERGVYIILGDSFSKFPNSLFIDHRASDEKIIQYIKTH